MLGGAWLGYDQMRGRFLDMDGALEALVAGDYRSAFQAAERLAPEGDVDAQTMLGWLYWQGHGTDQDFPAADRWLSRAAEQGDVRAMSHLADLHFYDYESLDGRIKNRPLAAEWYRRAAEAGSSHGQRRIGRLLIRGIGIDRDRDAGLAWMMKAIDAGNREAMHGLGYVYESGLLGEQNFQEALQLYRRAIRRGVQQSARQAIELLRDKRSPVFDLEEAYLWALVAHQWWSDHPTNGEYFVSMARTVHREIPQEQPPPDYALVTLGVMDEETYLQRLQAQRAALGPPESWPYRLDKEARRRSEEAANAIIARWPEPPTRDEVVEE